ncbi:MAG: sigma-70 family RNA polymerase sigma factor [Lachnospiraceae bacterium]
MQYADMEDEAIVACSQQGDSLATDYLLRQYTAVVKQEVRTLYLIGADSEDLIQEGMIALFKAIHDYDAKKGMSFSSFARLCISRQVYSSITAMTRKKHAPLNTYLSFHLPSTEDSNVTLGETLRATEYETNPEEMLLMEERIANIKTQFVQKLSKMEQQVLQYYLDGMGYVDIARKLGKTPKSIDNAIQRIRAKLRQNLE